jgi:hypothetical protein
MPCSRRNPLSRPDVSLRTARCSAEALEKSLREKDEALLQVNKKVDKFTTKSRAAMESIVKSLMDR